MDKTLRKELIMSKAKLTPLPTEKKKNSKPFIERATNWVTTNVIPYVALAFMALATADSVVQRSKQLDKLTDMQRGALSLFMPTW